MSLSASKVLGLFEIPHVLVVSDDRHQVFYSSEVMSSLFECLDDCQEFSVIDVIIPLSWGEGGRMVGTGVEISIGILLD